MTSWCTSFSRKHACLNRLYNADVKTMLDIVDAMDSFGTVRTEPTLVIGGGLVTDTAGYACASYRRTSNFIRVPTTLIGLIDASVSIKVGINHKKLKNRYVLFPLLIYEARRVRHPEGDATGRAKSGELKVQSRRLPCSPAHLPRLFHAPHPPRRAGP